MLLIALGNSKRTDVLYYNKKRGKNIMKYVARSKQICNQHMVKELQNLKQIPII
jgi:hypothetical protein